jgi:hypothetical protein
MKTCPHLEPIERALAARGIALGDGVPSPYGPQSGTWFPCNCVFQEKDLRTRLQLADCVTYEENFGFSAGSDAAFYCSECKRAIWGSHPKCASWWSPRLK